MSARVARVLLWAVFALPALIVTIGYRDEHGWTPFLIVLVLSLLGATFIPGILPDDEPIEKEVPRQGEKPEHMRTWDL